MFQLLVIFNVYFLHTRTVTSTITNCDEVSCSQDVVTYTTNVPHTTVDATTTITTSTGGDNSTGGNESGSNHGQAMVLLKVQEMVQELVQ